MEEVFTKTLTKTDIEHRLTVPTASLEAFAIAEGAYQVDFEAIDINGTTWNFRLSTRRNDSNPKPVLSAGWLEFVRNKRLREKDRVIFHKSEEVPNEVRRFRIQAQRNRVRLFGEDHWADVENLNQNDVN